MTRQPRWKRVPTTECAAIVAYGGVAGERRRRLSAAQQRSASQRLVAAPLAEIGTEIRRRSLRRISRGRSSGILEPDVYEDEGNNPLPRRRGARKRRTEEGGRRSSHEGRGDRQTQGLNLASWAEIGDAFRRKSREGREFLWRLSFSFNSQKGDEGKDPDDLDVEFGVHDDQGPSRPRNRSKRDGDRDCKYRKERRRATTTTAERRRKHSKHGDRDRKHRKTRRRATAPAIKQLSNQSKHDRDRDLKHHKAQRRATTTAVERRRNHSNHRDKDSKHRKKRRRATTTAVERRRHRSRSEGADRKMPRSKSTSSRHICHSNDDGPPTSNHSLSESRDWSTRDRRMHRRPSIPDFKPSVRLDKAASGRSLSSHGKDEESVRKVCSFSFCATIHARV